MTRPTGPSSASRVKTGLAEDVVQRHVADMCAWAGVAHYHTRNSRGSEYGFLDSFCVGPGGARVFECKDDDGQTTPEQDLWMWLLENIVGIPVMVVRPVDTRPRPDLGGKTRIQHEIAAIARGPGGGKFPPDIAAAIRAARNAEARRLAATIRKSKARRS